jgi:hypothetical protein
MSVTTTEPPPGNARRSRSAVVERTHPMHRFAGWLHEACDRVADAAVWSMSEQEISETLTELYAAQVRIAERIGAVLAQAERDGLASRVGATTTAAWLADLTRLTRASAHRDLRMALALSGGDHESVRSAMAAGTVTIEQARVVVAAVDRLPQAVAAADRPRAERHLLGEAGTHDAKALEQLGRHLVDVVDPDAADERLATRLESEERRAERTASFSMHDDGQGRCHGRFTIPSLQGAMLAAALQAVANPALADPVRRERADGGRVPTPEVMGEAFGRYVERFPTDRLPSSGGVAATVVVTMPLDTLLGGLEPAGVLGTDLQLSAATARRLACRAGVVPAVLDSTSLVLDLGRKVRLHTRSQRLAMSVQQDGRCAVDRCDTPAGWCDAHHLTPWSEGGRTSTKDGVLLCPRHHKLAHDPRLRLRRAGTGSVSFHRRT